MRAPLPRLYIILDRPTADAAGVDLVDVLHAAARAGARLFQLRDKAASTRSLTALSARVVDAALEHPGARVLINGRADVARAVGAHGVHLPSSGASPAQARAILGPSHLIACSVHDEAELAAADGASFATLSPIYPTSSKPGYGPALGPDSFTRFAALAPGLPLFALGGVTPARARACIARGAHGAAAMSSLIADPALAAAFPHDAGA